MPRTRLSTSVPPAAPVRWTGVAHLELDVRGRRRGPLVQEARRRAGAWLRRAGATAYRMTWRLLVAVFVAWVAGGAILGPSEAADVGADVVAALDRVGGSAAAGTLALAVTAGVLVGAHHAIGFALGWVLDPSAMRPRHLRTGRTLAGATVRLRLAGPHRRRVQTPTGCRAVPSSTSGSRRGTLDASARGLEP